MKYLLTGGSGYIGTKLTAALAGRGDTKAILIADLKPPKLTPPKTGFRRLDVRDAAATADLIYDEQPDVVVHLAWMVDPLHAEDEMYEIDVNGTFNVLAGASGAGTGHVLVMSATLAYGPWPDNPVPILEGQPVHGHARYVFARHKSEADRIAQLWATLHPERVMTIARSSIVCGPGANNHFSRMWQQQPFFPDFGGPDQQAQFIHEDDLTESLLRLIAGKNPGAFNIAAEGTISWRECAEIAGLKVRHVQEESFTAFASGLWRMSAGGDMPPAFMDFFKHPWVVANDKLKRTLGWVPEYSSTQAFQAMIDAQNRSRLPG